MTANHAATEARRTQRQLDGCFSVLSVPLWLSSFSSSRAQEPQREIRIGVLRPGGGYTVQTFPLETYIARVLAGEAGARQPAGGARGAGDHDPDLRAGEPRPPQRRRLRPLRSDPLSGDADADARARARGRRPRPVGRSCETACRRRSSTRRRAAGRPRFRPRSGPGTRIRPTCRRSRTTRAWGSPVWTAEIEGDGSDARPARRRVPRRPAARLPHPVAGCVGTRRSTARRRVCAGGNLRTGPAGRRRAERSAGSTSRARRSSSNASAIRYRFEGRGSGHGVGMCVIGSMNLAVAGRTATEILNRYFPGLEIAVPATLPSAPSPAVVARGRSTTPAPAAVRAARSAPLPPPPATATSPAGSIGATATAVASGVGGVALALPDEDEGERDAIAQLTEQARSDIALALRRRGAAARDRPFSPDDGQLRACDRPAVVYVGRHRRRRTCIWCRSRPSASAACSIARFATSSCT